jgi:NAD(P)-dependent dehydrogenase (short-subunit alcohol dehydrogenase family)
VAQTVERFGRLDVLVNNTGINPTFGFLMDADLGAVAKTFETNVVAALAHVQLAYRAWMGEHGGAVVNVASVAGLRSTGAIAAYGASKAALIRLTEELAWQLGPASASTRWHRRSSRRSSPPRSTPRARRRWRAPTR